MRTINLLLQCFGSSVFFAPFLTSQAAVLEPQRYDVIVNSTPVNKSDVDVNLSDLFGVHSLWWATQRDLANENGDIFPAAANSLKNSGVSYVRYGGGVNEIDWKKCIGLVKQRIPQKVVTWSGPMKCLFGIDEYERLNNSIDAKQSWYVANLVGYEFNESDLNVLADSAADYAEYVKMHASKRIRFWEMGNELAEGRQRWAAQKIVLRTSHIIGAIHHVDPDARFVFPLLSFQPSWIANAAQFNDELISSMVDKSLTNDFALHVYYDNPPEGPSVTGRLAMVDRISHQLANHGDKDYGIWITEHARWPAKLGDDTWQSYWYQSADFNGLLSSADFIIGLTQITYVKGAIWHSLRGLDWSMIGKKNTGYKPTAVGQLFSFLNHGLKGYRALITTVRDTTGGKDKYGNTMLRASAISDGQCIRLWIVNRAEVASEIALSFTAPQLLSSLDWQVSSMQAGMYDNAISSSRPVISDNLPLSLNIQGQGTYILPAKSVSILNSCDAGA